MQSDNSTELAYFQDHTAVEHQLHWWSWLSNVLVPL